LDGLRGVAILCVLVGHSTQSHIHVAAIGVTLFFVLSGYLITTLLVTERARSGRVDLRAFWTRRARRLLPALLLMVAVTATFQLSIGAPGDRVAAKAAVALLYVQNFANAHFGQTTTGMFAHTWSLAMEEQFYLAWPLAFAAVVSRRLLLAALAAVVVLSLVFRAVAGGDPGALHSPLAAASPIALGCCAALLIQRLPKLRAWAALIPLALLCALPYGATLRLWAAPIAAVLCVPLVLAAARDETFGATVLQWIGRRSYGIYLWHVPVGLVTRPLDHRWQLTVVFAGSFAIAALSWRYLERPILERGSEVRHDDDKVWANIAAGTTDRVIGGPLPPLPPTP
jgi:peptidoglycan/LPS O-acetylase OafA/YrhL